MKAPTPMRVLMMFERALQLCLALDEAELLPRVYDGLVVNYHSIRSQPERIIQYTHDMTSVHERTGAGQALFMQRGLNPEPTSCLGISMPPAQKCEISSACTIKNGMDQTPA